MSVDKRAYETIGALSATVKLALDRLSEIGKQDDYFVDLDLSAAKRILGDGLQAYEQFRKEKGWDNESTA